MKRTVFRGALLLAMLTICAMPASAAQKRLKTRTKKTENKPGIGVAVVGPECPAGEGIGWAGFRAFIDPQTGELREPTPEEARAFNDGSRAQSAYPAESLEVLVHPDGMVSVDLKGHFMQSLVVARNPDGSLSMRCGPGAEKPATVARPASPGTPALEER